jgi:hypothetical protein
MLQTPTPWVFGNMDGCLVCERTPFHFTLNRKDFSVRGSSHRRPGPRPADYILFHRQHDEDLFLPGGLRCFKTQTPLRFVAPADQMSSRTDYGLPPRGHPCSRDDHDRSGYRRPQPGSVDFTTSTLQVRFTFFDESFLRSSPPWNRLAPMAPAGAPGGSL